MIRLNGHEIKPTIFSDGTSQIWKIDESIFKERLIQEQSIVWDFENEAEFIHLAQLCDLIQAKGGYVDRLHIPYFPYARQDKEISNSATFAKSTFIKLLKGLPNVMGISTVDIHSDAYSREISSESSFRYVQMVQAQVHADLACFPDKGAEDRYKHELRYLSTFSANQLIGNFPHCSFSKERDQDTGYIKGLYLNESVDPENKTVLIWDDLCDGGMTFKLTAEKLLTMGAKEVILYTTHGIYSKGVQTLLDSGISRVFNYKGEVFPSKQTRFLLKEF